MMDDQIKKMGFDHEKPKPINHFNPKFGTNSHTPTEPLHLLP